ncbi:hypothetical protein BGZ97_000700, partial [Linnemannia gamsii]
MDVAGGLVNGTTGVVTKIYGKNVVQIRTEDLQYTARAQDDKKQMVKSGDNSHCNVFASRQAYVALSRVRTKNDLFIKDWNLQGLLNVKHVIRTRLTKESEDARTAIDDKIDEMEERMADGSRTE